LTKRELFLSIAAHHAAFSAMHLQGAIDFAELWKWSCVAVAKAAELSAEYPT